MGKKPSYVKNTNKKDEFTIHEETIQYEGNFKLKNVYNKIHWLFRDKGFSIWETKYEVEGKGDKKDVLIDWKCYKRVSDYMMFKLKINYEVYQLKDVEIVKNGRTKKTQNGTFKLSFEATMYLDPDNQYGKNSLLKKLREWYDVYYFGVPTPRNDLGRSFNQFKKQMESYLSLLNENINGIRTFLGMPKR